MMKKGVTLIELLIVVLILAALSAIAIPKISQSAQNARQNSCDSNVDIINSSVERYYLDNGSYPDPVTDLTEDLTYFPDGPPVCPLGGDYNMKPKKRAECNH